MWPIGPSAWGVLDDEEERVLPDPDEGKFVFWMGILRSGSHSGGSQSEIRRIKADKNPISDQFMLRRIEHVCSFTVKTKKLKI